MAENTSVKGMIARLGDAQSAPPWGLGEVALVIVALFVASISFSATLASDPLNPDPISLVIGWMIGLAIVFVLVLLRWRRTKERFDALQLHKGTWHPLLALMVGIAGAFTASVLVGLGSGQFLAPSQVIGIDSSNTGSLFLVALFVLIAQPLAESMIFYAVTLPRLRASFGAWLGLIATTILYALYYYLLYGSRGSANIVIWYGAIYPFVTGFTLGAVRIWSQSSRATILAHIGVGISVIIILLLI